MTESEPNLVQSSRSQALLIDGYRFQIEIYRLEHQDFWTLEAVDFEGTSHVWDDRFVNEDEALNAAVEDILAEGAVTFMRGNNVVPFKRSRPPVDSDRNE